MKRPTDRQLSVLRFVAEQIRDNGYAPTVREICAHFGWSSTNASVDHLRYLEKKRLLAIDRDPGEGYQHSRHRNISVTDAGYELLGMLSPTRDERPLVFIPRCAIASGRGVYLELRKCPRCRTATFLHGVPCRSCGSRMLAVRAA